MRFLAAIVALTCVAAVTAAAPPKGFLYAIVAQSQYRGYAHQIDVNTGANKQVGEYLSFDMARYPNCGHFNKVNNKMYFMGETLTFRQNGDPNPIGNFLTSLDADGNDFSSRMIQHGGWVFTTRADDAGVAYALEQSTSSVDVKFSLLDYDGGVDPQVSTGINNYVPGAQAVDSANGRFFSVFRPNTTATTLATIDIKGKKVAAHVALQNPGNTRIALCYDGTTKGLYSLEKPAGSTDSALFLVNPGSGQSDRIAAIRGNALQADCRDGTFFVSGQQGTQNYLGLVDLQTQQVTYKNLAVKPGQLVFFAQ